MVTRSRVSRQATTFRFRYRSSFANYVSIVTVNTTLHVELVKKRAFCKTITVENLETRMATLREKEQKFLVDVSTSFAHYFTGSTFFFFFYLSPLLIRKCHFKFSFLFRPMLPWVSLIFSPIPIFINIMHYSIKNGNRCSYSSLLWSVSFYHLIC